MNEEVQSIVAAVNELTRQISFYKDKSEKLEAALRRIEDSNNYGSDGCWVADSYPDEIARAALGKEGDKYDGWR
jgi:cell division protein FtsB